MASLIRKIERALGLKTVKRKKAAKKSSRRRRRTPGRTASGRFTSR
jgi:hypothetical protein